MKLHYCESCERFWYFNSNSDAINYTTVWENPLAPILCVDNDSICPDCETENLRYPASVSASDILYPARVRAAR